MVLAVLLNSWLSSLGQLIGVFVIFVVVLLITWFVTRWIAGYQQSQMHNQNLKVIETLKLTVNSYMSLPSAKTILKSWRSLTKVN